MDDWGVNLVQLPEFHRRDQFVDHQCCFFLHAWDEVPISAMEVELGYFLLQELKEARGPLGLPIERDIHFERKTLKELMEMYRRMRKE